MFRLSVLSRHSFAKRSEGGPRWTIWNRRNSRSYHDFTFQCTYFSLELNARDRVCAFSSEEKTVSPNDYLMRNYCLFSPAMRGLRYGMVEVCLPDSGLVSLPPAVSRPNGRTRRFLIDYQQGVVYIFACGVSRRGGRQSPPLPYC
jgi:hypothetical protein